MSDALVNDGKVQGSTDVRGEYLDNGSYDPTVGTYAPPYQAIAKVWRSANSLKLRLDLMDGDESSERYGYYTAYLYQALPCYLLGTYYGNGPSYPRDGGATLNESAFLPSDELYSILIKKLQFKTTIEIISKLTNIGKNELYKRYLAFDD